MKSPLKTLSQETAIYGLSTVVGRFLNFLLVPFYVNVLRSRAEYGFTSSLYAYLAFLSVVFPLGLEGAYFRYAARAEGAAEERDRERRLFSTPFWVVVGFAAAIGAALFFAAPSLVVPLFADPQHDVRAVFPLLLSILRLGAVILFFDALAVLPFASLRLEHRARTFAAIKIGNILLTLALNFAFLLKLRWGVEGIFRANAIASAATFVAVLPAVASRLAGRFDRSVLAKMLPFGLANVPAYLGAMMVQVIDRPIVQRLRGFSDLGVYQANYRMGFAMMVLVSVFDYAWRPFFLRQYATEGDRAKPLLSRVFTYTAALSLFAFLALAFFLPWFVGIRLPVVHRSLLRKDYLSGVGVIPVVLLAYVFQMFATNFIAGIYIREKTSRLPIVTGLGALVNVVTNLWWVPIFGILGAAYATLAAYVVMAAAMFLFSQRAFPIRYERGRLGRLALVSAGVYAAGKWSGSLAAQAALIVTAFVLLWLGGFFTTEEIAFFRRMFGRPAPVPAEGPVVAEEKDR
ncbi:MAG TPA: polysaccharide biosynthesis C-terminal domain-containing protein [Thermoanaerobaculia bacterium]|nr:polysaccharide biosynthesis C-terminal domain-containing protein [Thermoanaerobaculia bacterium]